MHSFFIDLIGYFLRSLKLVGDEKQQLAWAQWA